MDQPNAYSTPQSAAYYNQFYPEAHFSSQNETHLRLLSPPLVNRLQGVLIYRATPPHLLLHSMNYNDKEFSNYRGFIKIAKKKKTANFIEFSESLLKIIKNNWCFLLDSIEGQARDLFSPSGGCSQMASRATNTIYSSVSRSDDRISIKGFEINL